MVVSRRDDRRRMPTTGQTSPKSKTASPPEGSGATTGYEAKLWEMADALRGSMDAALYKHVVLGLIFLKYVSDAFEETRVGLEAEIEEGADPEDPDEYRALNIFWVPKEARWSHLQAQARQPTIGQTVDRAMAAIERDNKALKGCPAERTMPGRLSTSVGSATSSTWSGISRWGMRRRDRRTCSVGSTSTSCPASPTPRASGAASSTPLAVWCGSWWEMLQPYNGRVYDPCCGSSGMFVQSMEFMRAHATGNGNGGRAKGRHLDLRSGVQLHHMAACEDEPGHPGDRRPDRPTATPSTTIATPISRLTTSWPTRPSISPTGAASASRTTSAGGTGFPPPRNANFAWVQHMIHHLSTWGLGRVRAG